RLCAPARRWAAGRAGGGGAPGDTPVPGGRRGRAGRRGGAKRPFEFSIRYPQNAGITQRAGCPSLPPTLANLQAEKGVSPFQLQQWLGHANLNTTQIYSPFALSIYHFLNFELSVERGTQSQPLQDIFL